MVGQKKSVTFAAKNKPKNPGKRRKGQDPKKANELFNWNNWGRDPRDTDSDDSDYLPPDVELETKPCSSRAGTKRTNRGEPSTGTPAKNPKTELRTTWKPGSKAHFHDLPPEILEIVFQYALEEDLTADRRRLMKVCSRWYHELRQPRWWTTLDLEHGWVKNGLKYLKNLHERGFLVNLKSLTLYKGTERNTISTDYMQWLAETFPRLEELNIRKAPNLNGDWLTTVSGGFKELKKLDLSFCSPNHSTHLGQFMVRLLVSKKLTSLKLRHFWHKRHIPSLAFGDTSNSRSAMYSNQSITVLDMSENSIPSLSNVMKNFPEQIRVLRLDCCWIDPIPIQPAIDHEYCFRNLVEFSANGLEMMRYGTPMLVRILEKSVKLKYLGLHSWDVRFLEHMDTLILPELESICLSRIRSPQQNKLVYSKHQVHLPHCENLDELLIDQITADKEFMSNLLESVVSTKLRRFDAQKSTIEASHIRKILKKNPDLEALDLTNCRELERGERPLLKTKSEIRSYYKKLQNKA